MSSTNRRPIPEAALRDADSVEMLSVWIAEQGLHCSIKIGMYEEQGVDESRAWGILLSDVVRHISKALDLKYRCGQEKVVSDIKRHFLSELGSPSSDIPGTFL